MRAALERQRHCELEISAPYVFCASATIYAASISERRRQSTNYIYTLSIRECLRIVQVLKYLCYLFHNFEKAIYSLIIKLYNISLHYAVYTLCYTSMYLGKIGQTVHCTVRKTEANYTNVSGIRVEFSRRTARESCHFKAQRTTFVLQHRYVSGSVPTSSPAHRCAHP